MNIRKTIEGIKRVLGNKGKIEIVNHREEKLIVSDEILQLISYLESVEKENLSLRSQIESNKKSIAHLNKAKEFIDDFKVRKQMLESGSHFQMLLKLYKGKKMDRFIYDGNLSDSDMNLIQLFELIEKLKL